jgi:hypothetical protein
MRSNSVRFLFFLRAAAVQAQKPLPPTDRDVAPTVAGHCALRHNGPAVSLGLHLDSFERCPPG